MLTLFCLKKNNNFYKLLIGHSSICVVICNHRATQKHSNANAIILLSKSLVISFYQKEGDKAMNLERIKELMHEQNMSAYAVAKRTGLSQAAVGQWLRGKNSANVSSLKKLAECFNVSITELM